MSHDKQTHQYTEYDLHCVNSVYEPKWDTTLKPVNQNVKHLRDARYKIGRRQIPSYVVCDIRLSFVPSLFSMWNIIRSTRKKISSMA